MIGLTISLARELASKGFCVNCVAPGLMLTEMIADAVAADPDSFNKRVPIGRLGATQEIADVTGISCLGASELHDRCHGRRVGWIGDALGSKSW